MPGVGFIRPAGGGGAGGGGATLEIGVYSDAGHTTPITEADFGARIYIKSTVTGITPTEYRFFVFETASNGVATVQVGNSISYDITSFNDLVIYAEAKDASVAAASVAGFEVTINADADATEYIDAHNTASGQTMAAAQQEVNQTFVQMLKGSGTTLGNNVYPKIKELYLFCPVDNTTVSIPAYAIDLIDPSTPATWAGFVVSDYAVTGVINTSASAAKFLQMKKAPSDFPQNSISLHIYSRSEIETASRWAMGSSVGTNYTMIGSGGSNRIAGNINSSVIANSPDNNLLGFISINRTASNSIDFYRNGSYLNSQSSTSTTPVALTFRGFQVNGQSFASWSKELSMLMLAEGFTSDEMSDLNEAIDYYQTNIITGGRNV